MLAPVPVLPVVAVKVTLTAAHVPRAHSAGALVRITGMALLLPLTLMQSLTGTAVHAAAGAVTSGGIGPTFGNGLVRSHSRSILTHSLVFWHWH